MRYESHRGCTPNYLRHLGDLLEDDARNVLALEHSKSDTSRCMQNVSLSRGKYDEPKLMVLAEFHTLTL